MRASRWVGLGALSALMPLAALGQLPRRDGSPLAEKAYRHPDLHIPNRYQPATELLDRGLGARRDLASLGVPPAGAFLDPRSGRWATLLPAEPLLPGRGLGNTLTWEALRVAPPGDRPGLERAAREALERYLRAHGASLGIDPAELASARVTVHDGGERIQLYAPRRIAGVPVRDSFLTAVLNHGNLVLFGARHWGRIDTSTRPALAADAARARLEAHLTHHRSVAERRRPELVLLPLAAGRDRRDVAPGDGYRFRLAWRLAPVFAGDPGRWEALVDAHSGELLAFHDTNRYATTRTVVGGVYPVSNDGLSPDGIEQAGTPMPFAEVASTSGPLVTVAGGNVPVCVEGTIATTLDGSFVGIADACGPIDEASAADLDLGAGPGIDCDVPVPGVSSPGNTHASRTAFYELNRVQEAARGQLPDNGWLRAQLGAVVNLDFGVPEFLCNAFWDETTVNFFVSGQAAPGVVCSNTGEIAGVLDHEWGHGLDDNDAVPTISNPAEGIADVYAALRLEESCIARGFFVAGGTCGDDDPCTECDGVRDIDWARRESGEPHDVAWIDAHCQPPFLGDLGPCGGGIHCEGAVVSEAVWDLVHRDLPGAPFGLDSNAALELGTRLTYLGAGGVGTWFQCVDGTGTGDGCNGDGGYLNFLAIDDDNGDLTDGTPRMEAIHAAFDRHGIACGTPVVQNGGCAGAPTGPPVVSATPLDRGARLTWSAVGGTDRYQVFRTDGVHGCDFGKVKVGETTATEFLDAGLRNGREVSYVVLPVGTDATCTGSASACVAVTPVAGAHLALDPGSVALNALDGDLDPFLDNCETAELAFDLVNLGNGPLTDVTLVDVQPLSHPQVLVTTSLPVVLTPSLATCESVTGSFGLAAEGLSFNDTVEFRVDILADEFGGLARSYVLRSTGAEIDIESLGEKTFGFEDDLEAWEVDSGTFDRTDEGGGAEGSAFYLASSADLPDQCDAIRSPLLLLSPSSTLSLWNQFDIEPPFVIEEFVFWYDRANVGIRDVATGQRTPIAPDGGRLYNASGSGGSCETNSQDGWANAAPSWAESTWSPTALGAAEIAGKLVQLDVRYGTDVAVEGAGFWFDGVTVTDLGLVGPDGQGDVCPPTIVFADDFESGHTGAWSITVP